MKYCSIFQSYELEECRCIFEGKLYYAILYLISYIHRCTITIYCGWPCIRGELGRLFLLLVGSHGGAAGKVSEQTIHREEREHPTGELILQPGCPAAPGSTPVGYSHRGCTVVKFMYSCYKLTKKENVMVVFLDKGVCLSF